MISHGFFNGSTIINMDHVKRANYLRKRFATTPRARFSAIDSSIIHTIGCDNTTFNSETRITSYDPILHPNTLLSNPMLLQKLKKRSTKTTKYCDGRGTFSSANTTTFNLRHEVSKLLTPLSTQSSQVLGQKVQCQMETSKDQTSLGNQSEEGDKEVNTILDTVTKVEVTELHGPMDQLGYLASSEPLFQFDNVTSRWIPLSSIQITTSHKAGDIVKVITLLDDVFRVEQRTPNMMFFRNFVAGRFNSEVKGLVNSNAFNQGLAIMSAKFDVYQMDGLHNTINADLSRKHVIFNLSTNATQLLKVPFRYSRPLLPLSLSKDTSGSIRPMTFARLYVRILSPLVTGTNARTSIDMRLFIRFTKAEFAGMTYDPLIQPQIGMWDVIAEVAVSAGSIMLGNPLPATQIMVKYVERTVNYIRKKYNFDRPVELHVTRVVPEPSMDFASGKGISNAHSLRINPNTGTNMIGVKKCPDDPKSWSDIAQMWGLECTVVWSADDPEGKVLLTWVPDPTIRNVDSDTSSIPAVRYSTNNFANWQGTIECKLVFVCSRGGHSGAVMMSFEPLHATTDTSKLQDAASSYYKVFQLGEQEEFVFTTPYIDVNIMRKTCASFGNFFPFATTSDDIKYHALNVAHIMNNVVRLRVVNELRPVGPVSPSIEVMMFIRGGKNFTLHGLKPGTYSPITFIPLRPNFPEDFKDVVKHPDHTDSYGERDMFKYSRPVVSKDLIREWKNKDEYRKRRLAYSAYLNISKRLELQDNKVRRELLAFRRLQKKATEKLSARDLQTGYLSLSDTECPDIEDYPDFDHPTESTSSTTSKPTTTQEPVATEATYVVPYDGFVGVSDRVVDKPVHNLFKKRNFKNLIIPVPVANSKTTYMYKGVTYVFDPATPDYIYNVDTRKNLGNVVVPQMLQIEDETPDFNDGDVAVIEQTLDIQMNFKDILRTPCLLIPQAVIGPHYITKDDKIKDQSCGFFIPIELPNFSNITTEPTYKNNFYSPVLYMTPHFGITAMFGNWRGSLQFVVVVHSRTAIVYGFMIPDGGTRIQGEHSLGEYCTRNVPVFGAGFPCTIISCAVNNVATIECPFTTNETWLKLHEVDSRANYTWQDKARTNCGHLVLWCKDPVVVDVWVRGGDDIEITNFLGIPDMRTSDPMVHLTDLDQPALLTPGSGGALSVKSVQIRTRRGANTLSRLSTVKPQMLKWLYDRPAVRALKNRLRFKAEEYIPMWFEPNPLLDIGIGLIPIIGSGLLTARKMHQGEQFIKDAAAVGYNFQNDLKGIANNHMSSIVTLARYAVDEMLKTFKVSASVATLVFDCMIDLLIAWVSRSWLVVGISLFRMIVKLCFSSDEYMSQIASYGQRFAEIVRNLIEPQAQAYNEDDSMISLYGLLISLVGMVTGITFDVKRTTSIPRSLFTALTTTTGIVYINHVIKLTTSVFTCIHDLIKQSLGYRSLKNHALLELSENSQLIQNFVSEAQVVINEMNDSMLHLPHYRMRMWKCVLQAEQLVRYLSQIPSNAVHRVLYDLCREVIRVGNKKFNFLKSCPVRIEPFVLVIEGETNCGKSHCMKILARECAKAINFNVVSDGYIYFRSAGERYWDGYGDQFAVGYDDFGQIVDQEMQSNLYSEIFKLRSPSTFIPSKAALEEKGQKCNPLLVIMSTNDAFPVNMDKYILCKQAFLRRRDIVIRCKRSSKYEGVNLSDPTLGLTDAMEHMEVQIYPDATDKTLGLASTITFAEAKDRIVREFKKHYLNEQRKMKKELDQYFADVCGPRSEQLRLTDPFALYYNPTPEIPLRERSDDWVASEEMRRHIEDICSSIELQNLQPDSPPPSPDLSQEEPRLDDDIEPQAWNTFEIPEIECSVCKRQTKLAITCECGFVICGDSCCKTLTLGIIPVCSRCPRYMNVHHVEDVYLYIYRYKRSLLGHHDLGRVLINQFCVRSLTTSFTSLANYLNIVRDRLSYMYAYSVNALFWHLSLDPVLLSSDSVSKGIVVDGVLQCKHKVFINSRHVWWDNGKYCCTEYPEGVSDFYDCIDEDLMPIDCAVSGDPISPKLREMFYLRIANHFSTVIRAPLQTYYGMNRQATTPDEHLQIEPYLYRSIPPMFKVYVKGSDVEQVFTDISWQDYMDWPSLGIARALQYGVVFLTYSYLLYRTFQVCSSLYTSFTTSSTDTSSEEAQGNYDSGTSKKLVRKVKILKVKKQGVNILDDKDDPPEDVFEAVQRKVVANTFVFTIVSNKSERNARCFGLGIYNRYVILPKHYKLTFLKLKSETLYGEPYGEKHLRQPIDPSWLVYSDVPDADLCVLKLPANFPMFKDIRKYMATVNDHEVRGLPRQGYIMSPPIRQSAHDIFREISVNISGYYDDLSTSCEGQQIITKEAIQYNYSQPGLCGAVLLSRNTQRPILGMHVAGTCVDFGFQGMGFSVMLIQEMFTDDVPVATEVETPRFTDDMLEMQMAFSEVDQVRLLGAVPSNLAPRIPLETKLRKSVIFTKDKNDILYTTKQPAILRVSDPRYPHTIAPLTAGVKKHGQLTLNFPKHILDMAESMLWDGVYSKLPPIVPNPTLLTYRQAVVGGLTPEYVSLRLDNSAGWPWCILGGSTKDFWIKTDNNPDLLKRKVFFDKRLTKNLNDRMTLRELGRVPVTVYIDTLKDEKRSPSKLVKLGGTRVFCNGNMAELIEYRRHFMHYIAATYKHRLSIVSGAVGINPMSSEWTSLALKLLSKGKNMVTIDYSNFGPGFNAEVHRRVCNNQKRWLVKNVKGINPTVVDCLQEGVINSFHLAKNVLYMQVSGSPSGAGPTTTDNTDVNEMYLLCAWIQMCLDNGIVNIWQEYCDAVYRALYGDDALLSVSTRYILQFNTSTISGYFSIYKITATNAEKDEEIVPFMELKDVRFLKRGFVKHDTRPLEYLSPLDWDSLVSITQWVWDSEDSIAATVQNCEAALLLAHQHGRQKFEDLKTAINARFTRLGIDSLTLTWTEVDHKFFVGGVDVGNLWNG
uniref:Polyprotein n=1 Tax=Bemisia tabaci picorna-like virus 2 TaxID=2840078 RepID=A0A8E8KRN7_9PICO|nr:polyprotein [Bemisia tabaci picorna-like virus 2]